ncbi:MAG TPA: multicopper oxidase domain-containing protein [Candidatus Baltobacteraceae bacterium]|nr:multicopper oxidase domain-containing protein [Candidatus Baltobacteraceae bacterium]
MPNSRFRLAYIVAIFVAIVLSAAAAAVADTDETTQGVNPASVGMQPLKGAIPRSTPAPGESRLVRRPDGTFGAVPDLAGRTVTFHLAERDAPWSLQPSLAVLAKTYNGVVPGPVLTVHQGDRVVIDYRNAQSVPDTLHLHGIHNIPISMDGVAGISQPMVMNGQSYRYEFTADQPGTFIYHSHDNEEMVNSGLYGAIVVLPAHVTAAQRADRDDVEILSSWAIQSLSENHFTINGKEYPYTTPIEVRKGQRIRIRWVNISGEAFHTMHTHGHYQRIIARDAQPVTWPDVEDTVGIGPGQRLDVLVDANQQPGNWLVHCHVLDHTEDSQGYPDGLITTIHYAGTPENGAAMNASMRGMLPNFGTTARALPFGWTILLGAIAGFTIFLGLPIARMRNISPQTIGSLNALAIGILVFLVVEIAGNATTPLMQALRAWHTGASPQQAISISVAYVVGIFAGLVGLGTFAARLTKRAASEVHDPFLLASIIAIGIGAHNFAEGLAIGASAASGATAIAIGLIVGFALHNATEGFGIAAPLAGRDVRPRRRQLLLAGIVAGGPTFVGTLIGYAFDSPVLSVLFLATAVGALVYVIGELWSVLRRSPGLNPLVTSMLACGFFIALATEAIVDLSGG